MTETIALIGFGEVGHGIGRGLAAEPRVGVPAYNIKIPTADDAAMIAKARAAGDCDSSI